jgi:hypothetical protein
MGFGGIRGDFMLRGEVEHVVPTNDDESTPVFCSKKLENITSFLNRCSKLINLSMFNGSQVTPKVLSFPAR